MKPSNTILLALLISFSVSSWAQPNEGLISLGKAYRQYMFRNSAPENVLTDLGKYSGTELSFAADFIKETIQDSNNILATKFIERPNDSALLYIYIIRQINYNIREEKPEDNNSIIKKLMKKDIPSNELIDCYYEMLFTAYGNKNQPFDLTSTNFELAKYHFRNDTEQAIFFLKAMQLCGTVIWGYINVAKPPNYERAMALVLKYPKFNSSPYYQFLDLNFPDFKMHIESEKKTQSYKEYYINKYYETLLNHLHCLQQQTSYEKNIYDLVLGSILKEEMFYKYSVHEDELKSLFTKYKK